MGNEYINLNNPLYISYAWADNNHPNIEKDVENLCEVLEANHIYYKRDKTNLCPYRWSIQNAEEEIGAGTAIIVVISERYMKSLHCMNEWHRMRENGKIWDRVFPIVLEDANITNKKVYNKFYKFFNVRKQKLIKQQNEGIIPLVDVEEKAVGADFFIDDLKDVYKYLAKYNYGDLSKLRENNYAIIIDQLKRFLQQQSGSIIIIQPTQIVINENTKKAFTFSIPDGLLLRDKEANNLFNRITNNHLFNLYGVGGSGKSSLAYLMMQKHKNDFNEIAYVVVNNNIKEEIVTQLNETLYIRFKEGEDKYTQLVSYLENSFKSTKPNLLVLDINELTDENKDYAKNINKLCPKNWKVLIISRENIDASEIMEKEDLNQKQDIEFLKELFLKRAGERYKGFKDLSKLFATLFYNPLLAEQLGFHLAKLPETKTLKEIQELVYGKNFKNKEVKGFAKLTNENNSTIIRFLSNLISYDNLGYNEKELLRHFVLWPVDFINYKVIKGLLEGVFEFDEDLGETLGKLSDRAILMTKISEDSSYSYKLHGLLAESLRGQIDVSKQDYSKYLDNIEKIIDYRYYDFLPYADCIGNSLCENDITDDFNILNNVGFKFYDIWKTDYAKRLFEKAITILSIKIEIFSNSAYYRYNLAIVYTNLALLQKNQLNDYESAETNYKWAIGIIKWFLDNNIPVYVDNPEFQDFMASVYNNLASLQKNVLNDYISAEINYGWAILIRKDLPKKNHKYQDSLATVYCNLANLQKNISNDYRSAETNYNRAIEIGEQLPKANSEYQYWLANAYGNLADLQKDYRIDNKSAETNYKKEIEIKEQLPKNPAYQDGLASAYNGFAVFQQYDLYDNESAEAYFKKAIETEEPLVEVNRKLFLIKWVEYKHRLADLYFDTEKVEPAKSILEEIKPLAEECLANNSNDEWTIKVNNWINNLWEKINK